MPLKGACHFPSPARYLSLEPSLLPPPMALKSLQGHGDLSGCYSLAYTSHPSSERSSYDVRMEPNARVMREV